MSYQKIEEENLTRAEKGMVRMRSLTNYVMGLLLIGAGFLIFFPTPVVKNFTDKYDELAIKMLAVICFIYGFFRMYRGYKKNYFRAS
jgi:hypothetical protein